MDSLQIYPASLNLPQVQVLDDPRLAGSKHVQKAGEDRFHNPSSSSNPSELCAGPERLLELRKQNSDATAHPIDGMRHHFSANANPAGSHFTDLGVP